MEITIGRKPLIIGVMGGHEAQDGVLEEARTLGEGIAQRGHVLLTGGGTGIMRAASEGAFNAGGLVLAILPNDRKSPMPGYPNEFVHIPIYTGLSDARNAINAKTPHLLIALPGGFGTLSEIALAFKADTPVISLRWPDPPVAVPLDYVCVQTVKEVLTEMDRKLAPHVR